MSDSEDSSQWTDEDDDEDDDEEEDDEDVWKDSVKRRLEEEIAKRVAEALPETPPLERLRRRQEAARRAAELADKDLNAHLDFTDEFYHKKEGKGSAGIRGRLHGLDMMRRNNEEEIVEPEQDAEHDGKKKDVQRQYQFYEPTKPLPNLSHYATVTNSSLTSFDVNSIEPLLPHPVHLHIIPTDPEPLYTPIRFVIGSRTYENQQTQFTHKLRGIGVVFDSEKSPKIQKVELPNNPLIAPNLVFESRFESGNLRQARRVGQFEYELVLKTDMYTKRHTQWYYFRIQNAVPGIIYKFRIVNLLKKDSLYNYGMRPLFYSERTVNEKRQGWIRSGHHISYGRNVQHLLCPLLNREMAYYELEWQMEFPYSGDTCYVAHCYPFSHQDLRCDIHNITTNPINKSIIQAEVLCETKAGHDCYLLTITNFEKILCNKKCVVVSARVHPGESNSSWMMKGLYEFLLSDHPEAKELRDKFVFKIVPMLNPDGVIVGNYRCSLQARDLNRNYRWPKRERFPTIWNIKQLVNSLQQDCGVFVYCDFHGHSRKSNVFMYGNSTIDPKESKLMIREFLNERMLPFIISQLDGEMFSFQSSRFAIKKCKESTGRVAMFRQYNIVNSFTMEATFSGTKIDQHGSRHYNQQDFMDAGALFAKGVLQYSKVIEDETKESEAVLSLAKNIAQQAINNSLRKKLANQNRVMQDGEENGHSGVANSRGQSSSAATQSSAHSRTDASNLSSKASGARTRKTSKSSLVDGDDLLATGAKEAMERLTKITSNSKNSVQQCFDLLESLDIENAAVQPASDSSSDSDSESEPEMVEEKVKKKKKNKKNKKKKDAKKQQKTMANISGDYVMRNFKPAALKSNKTNGASINNINAANNSSSNSNVTGSYGAGNPGQLSAPSRLTRDEDDSIQGVKALPAISEPTYAPTAPIGSKMFNIKGRNGAMLDPAADAASKLPAGWANPYQHRTNGGIPCYSEERSLERAAKKMAELQKKVEERVKRQQNFIPYAAVENHSEFDLDLQELNSLKLQKKHVQDCFNKSIRMLTQSCIPNMGGYYNPAVATWMEGNPELQGQLDPITTPLRSEYSDTSSVGSSRKKKKSRTPINDKYSAVATPEYNTPRSKWHWHPGQSTNHNAPLQPINTKKTSWNEKQSNRNKIDKQSVLVSTKPSYRQQQSNSRSLFPPARLGPVSKVPQKAGGLTNVLRVNPMHHHHGFE